MPSLSAGFVVGGANQTLPALSRNSGLEGFREGFVEILVVDRAGSRLRGGNGVFPPSVVFMNTDVLLKLAAEGQHIAKMLSPYQNLGTVSVIDDTPKPSFVPSFFQRLRRMLAGSVPVPAAPRQIAELNTRDITRITNALLNVSNALEMLVKQQTPHEETSHVG